MTNIHVQASAMAALGCRVIPIGAGEKFPRISKWPGVATSDAAQIDKWFGPGGEYERANWGIVTSGGEAGDMLVVDVDRPKLGKGVDGMPSYDLMMALDLLPATRTHKSASDGRHLIYRLPPGRKLTRRRIKGLPDYPGIDILVGNSQIVGPGSRVKVEVSKDVFEEREYEVLDSSPIAEAPEWLLDEVRSVDKERPHKDNTTPLVELDTEGAVEQAIAYLTGPNVPIAIERAGGDDTTYKLFQRIKDFGISLEKSIELVDEHWNALEKADPPWSLDEIAVLAHNALSYGQNPPGAKSALLEFDNADVDPARVGPIEARAARFKLWSVAAAREIAFGARKPALIEDVFDQETFGCMFGGPGTGKTFAAMTMGYCISVGLPWDGRATTKCAVVHILAEGSLQGAAARLAAVDRANGSRDPQYFLIKDIVDLRTSNADVKALARAIRAEIKTGAITLPVGLVIIDTLNQAFAGGNENATEDMSAFVANVKALMAELSTAAMVIHHSGKDEARGARGSTVLLGAIDTEMQLTRGKDGDGTLENTKQRDLELFKKKRYAIDSVELGLDASGRMVRTALFRFVSQAEIEMAEDSAHIPPQMLPYYRCLESAVTENPDGISKENWAALYKEALADGDVPRGERTLREYRAHLQDQGCVVKQDDGRFTPGKSAETELPRARRGNGRNGTDRQKRQQAAAKETA